MQTAASLEPASNAHDGVNPRSAVELPENPVLVIEAGKSGKSINPLELWTHRELLYFLTWKDLKIRYKQTLLGVAWTILQPLSTLLIFSVIFGRFAAIPTEGIPYPLFVCAGLVPWVFFSNAITNAGNSIVGSSSVITKVYFPRVIIPAASIAASLVDFAISFVLLALLMLFYQVPLSLGLFMLVPIVVLTVVAALAVGMWLAALNVKYRDIRFALPFLIQLWMFVSPIIYPVSMLPTQWQRVFAFNPLTGLIEGYRSALFGRPFKWWSLAFSTAITLLVIIYSSYTFRRMEKTFADIV